MTFHYIRASVRWLLITQLVLSRPQDRDKHTEINMMKFRTGYCTTRGYFTTTYSVTFTYVLPIPESEDHPALGGALPELATPEPEENGYYRVTMQRVCSEEEYRTFERGGVVHVQSLFSVTGNPRSAALKASLASQRKVVRCCCCCGSTSSVMGLGAMCLYTTLTVSSDFHEAVCRGVITSAAGIMGYILPGMMGYPDGACHTCFSPRHISSAHYFILWLVLAVGVPGE